MEITNQSDTFDLDGELTVHRLGYGAMRITGDDIIGRPPDEDAAREVLQHAVDLGVDFIDTADSYGPGVSERLIRESLDPEDVIVATKAGLLRNRKGEWIPHASPDYIRNQLLVSQDRLGIESIDLYQLHTPNSDTQFEESIATFAELKDDGVIDHVGISNVNVDQLETARDHVDIATVQNQYNLANRRDEDVLEACEEYGIGFIPWYPLGAGGVGGDLVNEVATNHDASPYQIALAWLLEHSDVTLPIPGTSSIEHLEENVAASAIDLGADEYNRLTDAGSS